jgi:hypothetical protein
MLEPEGTGSRILRVRRGGPAARARALVVEITMTAGALATLDVSADCGTGSEHVVVQVEITKAGSAKVTLFDGY